MSRRTKEALTTSDLEHPEETLILQFYGKVKKVTNLEGYRIPVSSVKMEVRVKVTTLTKGSSTRDRGLVKDTYEP